MSLRRYLQPRLLCDDDEIGSFECRSAEQSEWLRRHARQASASDEMHLVLLMKDLRKCIEARATT